MTDKNKEQAQQEQDHDMGENNFRLVDLVGLIDRQTVMAHPDDFTWLDWERMTQ